MLLSSSSSTPYQAGQAEQQSPVIQAEPVQPVGGAPLTPDGSQETQAIQSFFSFYQPQPVR